MSETLGVVSRTMIHIDATYDRYWLNQYVGQMVPLLYTSHAEQVYIVRTPNGTTNIVPFSVGTEVIVVESISENPPLNAA